MFEFSKVYALEDRELAKFAAVKLLTWSLALCWPVSISTPKRDSVVSPPLPSLIARRPVLGRCLCAVFLAFRD